MKKTTLLFLFSGFLTIFCSYAQFDNYRLDKYVNPDYKRQSLDFEVSTTGVFDSYKTTQGSDETKEKNTSLDGDINVAYSKIQNSLSKQSETSLGLSFDGEYQKQKMDEITRNKNSEMSLMLSFSDESRYYFSNKKFVEFSPQVFGVIRNREEEKVDSDNDSKWYSINLSFRLGYGIGRIEHVEDARLAVYLLDDLKKNGVLQKDLTHDDIDRLAQCMTKVKFKRQFDSRIKLIDEIATVDSFLVANGIVNEQNTSRYFTALYDNWQYAGLITRLSGSRFSGGIAPGYNWSKNKWNDNKSYSSQVDGTLYVNYTYEKPVNLYWQHSAFIELGEEVGRVRHFEENYWKTYLSGRVSLGYYPNSRTYMTLRLSELFYFEDNEYWDGIYSSTNLAFDMYYYLSPQLRLSANANLNYLYLKEDYDDRDYKYSTNYPRFNFGATLTYSIF